MLKSDLIIKNPLRFFTNIGDDVLPPGGFGGILARAGLGKTAFIVQIALNSMLQDKNVLHISLHDPVKKVALWYEEVFRNLSQLNEINYPHQLWDSLLTHRFIMTFRVEGFSIPKLEERLTDLTEQNIFKPNVIIIDGMPFVGGMRENMDVLKALAERLSLHIWFTVLTHRHEQVMSDGLPPQISEVSDLFDAVFQLQPKDKDIHIECIKGATSDNYNDNLILDPVTMSLKDVSAAV